MATKLPAIAADVDGSTLTLTFSDGRSLSLDIDSGKLRMEIIHAATLHGLKQKLVDAAAMSCGPDGRPATIDDKYDAVREVYDRLLSGEWNKAREGVSTGGLLVTALCEITGKARDAIIAGLATKTNEEKAALRKNPKVRVILNRLEAERAGSSTIDSDALLNGLAD